MKKYRILIVLLGLIAFTAPAKAITLIISRTVAAHDPKGTPPKSKDVYREEKDYYSSIDGKLIQRKVIIQCYGNGTVDCPTDIVAPNNQEGNAEIPLNVVVFASDLYTPHCNTVDHEGIVPPPVNQTVMGSDGIAYIISIHSVLGENGAIVTTLSINSVS